LVGLAECSVVASFGSSWPLAAAAVSAQHGLMIVTQANIKSIENELKLE